MNGPWREPDEESVGLYPGLVVHDGRHSGSITVGRTRLPLNAILWDAITEDWEQVVDAWMPPHYYGEEAIDRDTLVQFLYQLLEMRGEFARLLLVLANAERVDGDRSEAELAPHGGVVRMELESGDGGVPWPKSWWEQPDLAGPVADQLRRCLAALEGSE